METITIPNTNITITVTNAEEMFTIFSRLHPWTDLEFRGTVFPQSTTTAFARSAFYQFFEGE